MFVLATRDRQWMRQCDAVLLADGVESRWTETHIGGHGAMLLDVPVSEGERVADLLSEQLGEELRALPPEEVAAPSPRLVLRPAFASALGLAVLLLAFYRVTGPFDPHSPWFARGALFASSLGAGEWYRLITAATLHADGGHAVGNAMFILVLGFGVSERVGSGWMFLGALLTAVAGFGVGLVLSDAAATVGASGGVFGLLGMGMGHGLRHAGHAGFLNRRRRMMQLIGGAMGLLAFTAFSPESNVYAHVGGFVAGMPLGMVLPKPPPRAAVQALLGTAAAGIVTLAWILAR